MIVNLENFRREKRRTG